MVNGDFDDGYHRWRSSRSHAALFGEGFPSSVQPFSFVPMAGLREVGDLLGLQPGRTLVDLGCGRGGPGLWLAAQSKAWLVGIDASSVAVADARQRRRLFPGIAGAEFHVGDAAATQLSAGSADAAVSIDVLQLLQEPAALLLEATRLLGPGRPFVATTWEGRGGAPQRFPRSVEGLLESAGLRVDLVEERPDWMRRQLSIYEEAANIASPDPAVWDLSREGGHWQGIHQYVRRVIVRGAPLQLTIGYCRSSIEITARAGADWPWSGPIGRFEPEWEPLLAQVIADRPLGLVLDEAPRPGSVERGLAFIKHAQAVAANW